MNIDEDALRKKQQEFNSKARYRKYACDWSKIDMKAIEEFASISTEELLIQAAKEEIRINFPK